MCWDEIFDGYRENWKIQRVWSLSPKSWHSEHEIARKLMERTWKKWNENFHCPSPIVIPNLRHSKILFVISIVPRYRRSLRLPLFLFLFVCLLQSSLLCYYSTCLYYCRHFAVANNCNVRCHCCHRRQYRHGSSQSFMVPCRHSRSKAVDLAVYAVDFTGIGNIILWGLSPITVSAEI